MPRERLTGHYLASDRSSSWETAAGLGAITNFPQEPEKDGISFVSYPKKRGGEILGVTPERAPALFSTVKALLHLLQSYSNRTT